MNVAGCRYTLKSAVVARVWPGDRKEALGFMHINDVKHWRELMCWELTKKVNGKKKLNG